MVVGCDFRLTRCDVSHVDMLRCWGLEAAWHVNKTREHTACGPSDRSHVLSCGHPNWLLLRLSLTITPRSRVLGLPAGSVANPSLQDFAGGPRASVRPFARPVSSVISAAASSPARLMSLRGEHAAPNTLPPNTHAAATRHPSDRLRKYFTKCNTQDLESGDMPVRRYQHGDAGVRMPIPHLCSELTSIMRCLWSRQRAGKAGFN